MIVANRKKQNNSWVDSDFHSDEGFILAVLIGFPFGVIAGGIAGIFATNVVPDARIFQALARAAILLVVGLLMAVAFGLWQLSTDFWVVFAGAWIAALVFGNLAEYRNLRPTRKAEPGVGADSR